MFPKFILIPGWNVCCFSVSEFLQTLFLCTRHRNKESQLFQFSRSGFLNPSFLEVMKLYCLQDSLGVLDSLKWAHFEKWVFQVTEPKNASQEQLAAPGAHRSQTPVLAFTLFYFWILLPAPTGSHPPHPAQTNLPSFKYSVQREFQ